MSHPEENVAKGHKESAEKKNAEPSISVTPVTEPVKSKPEAEPSGEGKKKKAAFQPLSTAEQQYYRHSCDKMREETTNILTIALWLAGCGLIGCIWLAGTKHTGLFSNVSLLFVILAELLFLIITIGTIMAMGVLNRFSVLAAQETRLGDKKHLIALFDQGYAYYQSLKFLAVLGIGSLLLFSLFLGAAFHTVVAMGVVGLAFLIGCGAYLYTRQIAKTEAQKNRKPLPFLEVELANLFPGSLPKEREREEKLALEIEEPLLFTSLSAVLKSNSPKIRRDVIKILARIGNTDAMQSIVSLLGDPAPEVRAQAVSAIGKSGAKYMREPLKCFLYDENTEVRTAAVEALGLLGDEDVFDILPQILDDAAPEVRGASTEALANLGNKKAIKYILPKLKDRDWFVRHKAVVALGKIKADLSLEAIDSLMDTARDDHQHVASSARHLLRKLAGEMSQKDPLYDEIQQMLNRLEAKVQPDSSKTLPETPKTLPETPKATNAAKPGTVQPTTPAEAATANTAAMSNTEAKDVPTPTKPTPAATSKPADAADDDPIVTENPRQDQ